MKNTEIKRETLNIEELDTVAGGHPDFDKLPLLPIMLKNFDKEHDDIIKKCFKILMLGL